MCIVNIEIMQMKSYTFCLVCKSSIDGFTKLIFIFAPCETNSRGGSSRPASRGRITDVVGGDHPDYGLYMSGRVQPSRWVVTEKNTTRDYSWHLPPIRVPEVQ